MTAMTPELEAPTLTIPVPGVLGRLDATSCQINRSRIWTGLVTFFVGALGIVAAFMLADWMWILPGVGDTRCPRTRWFRGIRRPESVPALRPRCRRGRSRARFPILGSASAR